RRRHTRSKRDWSSDVCSSDLETNVPFGPAPRTLPTWPVLVAAFAVLPAPVNAAAPTSAPRAIEPVIRAAMIVLRPKFMSVLLLRSEERRVGKGLIFWWAMDA